MNKNLKIKAKKLQKGDTICFLTVSGAIEDIKRIENAKNFFETEGFNVVLSASTFTQNRYMASNDKTRVEEIEQAFLNPKINAIVATRGGYGLLRSINNIDYKIIRNNPKIFVGFSDICNLLSMFYKKSDLIGFHGAMAIDFCSEIDTITRKSFFETLKQETKLIKAEIPKTYNSGIVQGILWGGNLSTLASMCGVSDFIPDEDLILFLEDWHDPVYKIDRMLTQLLSQPQIKGKIKGLVLGDFLGVDEPKNFDSVIREIIQNLNIPCCGNFLISHGKSKLTFPYGANVEFNATNGEIKFCKDYLIK